MICIPIHLSSARFPNKALQLLSYTLSNAIATRLPVLICASPEFPIDSIQHAPNLRIVTTGEHPNGTARIKDALNRSESFPSNVIINLQVDEPTLTKEILLWLWAEAQVLSSPFGNKPDIITLATTHLLDSQLYDKNVVKVTLQYTEQLAKHFSRGSNIQNPLRHIGIYAYTRSFLNDLNHSDRDLEQNDWMKAGKKIKVLVSCEPFISVDVPGDWDKFLQYQVNQ